MGLGKILLGSLLAGSLLFTGCDEHNITGDLDVTVKEDPVGEIIGKIIWDHDEDGIYEGTKAMIGLDNWPLLIQGGWKETSSTWEGNFSYHDVPVGSYTIYVQKSADYPLYHYWRGKEGATVVKQEVTDVGNIKIEAYDGSGY